jgi:putative FmdB family regulatory protein
MPIYQYRCAKGHAFELFQSMSDDPLSTCVECGAEAERVMSAPAVHFKGSGFYTTDYARKGAKKPAGDGGKESEKGEKGEKASTTSDSSSEKKSSGGDEGGHDD